MARSDMDVIIHAIMCVLMVAAMIGLGYATYRGIRSGWFSADDDGRC